MSTIRGYELEQVRNTRDELLDAIAEYVAAQDSNEVIYSQRVARIQKARKALDRVIREAHDEQRIEVEEAKAGAAELDAELMGEES